MRVCLLEMQVLKQDENNENTDRNMNMERTLPGPWSLTKRYRQLNTAD